jgi:hypothetical protein
MTKMVLKRKVIGLAILAAVLAEGTDNPVARFSM